MLELIGDAVLGLTFAAVLISLVYSTFNSSWK